MKKGDIHIATDDQDNNVILDGKHILCLESSLSIEVLVSGHVSHTWILDLVANFHVTPHREWFRIMKRLLARSLLLALVTLPWFS